MKLGRVTGEVCTGRTAECVKHARILLVEMEGSCVAALDRAQAQPGDQVLVVMGHAASRYSMEMPADAVITAVIKES